MKKKKSEGSASSTVSTTPAPVKRRLLPVIDRPGVIADLVGDGVTGPTVPDTPGASGSSGTSTGTVTGTASTTSASSGTSTLAVMSPPPDVTIPSGPAGFVPVASADLRGWRPTQSALAYIPDTILELDGFLAWSTTMGSAAEPAAQIAQRLRVAILWTAFLASSSDWLVYVKSQEGMAWKEALESIAALKPLYAIAVTVNPALAKQYPALARLLAVNSATAKRAVATKKKEAAAKASASAATAPEAPAPAATPAETDATPAARVVTVTG